MQATSYGQVVTGEVREIRGLGVLVLILPRSLCSMCWCVLHVWQYR